MKRLAGGLQMTMRNVTLLSALLALAAPAAAQNSGAHGLSVHGFLVQGVGVSDSMPVDGIPTAGTTDYRTFALQGRYAFDDNSSLVVQLSHHRRGVSALGQLDSPVELNWVFYRHRLGPVVLRAGRIPVPIGFYNEVRDVGTVLPFYRAPTALYPAGADAVDGVAATAMVDVGSWGLEAQAFAGGLDFTGVQHTPQGANAYTLRSDRTAGVVLLVSTPVTGLRAGGSLVTWKAESTPERIDIWVGSLELDRDRWMLRGEGMTTNMGDATLTSAYGHGRFKLTPQLHVVAQYERSEMELRVPVEKRYTQMDDRAVGLVYAVSANLALKLEAHRATGYGFDTFMNPFGPAASTNYGIASIAVSF